MYSGNFYVINYNSQKFFNFCELHHIASIFLMYVCLRPTLKSAFAWRYVWLALLNKLIYWLIDSEMRMKSVIK